MIVKCIKDSISELDNKNIKKWVKQYHRYDEESQMNIFKERQYVVYGIHFWDNHPFYFLCEDENVESDDYPVPYYAGFFEVIDAKHSANWRLSYKVDEDRLPWTSILHKDWVADPRFYENLVEGEEREVALFQKLRKEMDSEALKLANKE
ncbi:hypothetical protein OAP83_01475 [Rickettsiales bacterium]|nr:hypothetical protein [Rickettsiales bacterium]